SKPLVTALSGDPLYFSLEQPGRKLLVLSVNLDQGDLTFRTAFPIMATNALAWFAGQSGELRESLAAGAVTEVSLPAASGADILVCQTPSGKTLPLPAGAAKAAIGALDQCGIWQITKSIAPGATHAPILELACNLANRTDSDLRVPEKLVKSQPRAPRPASAFTRP